MEKEDNIVVPRWFLENVENTLRIQNNINLDQGGGETCQDRNVRESLNGLRKLLKGEELTGMERLEKLQPSLPSNLDEAAIQYAKGEYDKKNPATLPDRCKGCYAPLMYAFKDGAEWMAGQGITKEAVIGTATEDIFINVSGRTLDELDLCPGDKVVVQIRKK